MMSRLMENLNNFQIQFAICDRNLFTDWILRKANLQDSQANIQLTNIYSNKESVAFKLTDASIEEITKLCNFLAIPITEYRSEKPLLLSEELVFNRLVPEFKKEIEKIAEDAPKSLRTYQIESQSSLSDIAINKISAEFATLYKRLDEKRKTSKESLTPDEIDLALVCLSVAKLTDKYSYRENYDNTYLFAAIQRVSDFFKMHTLRGYDTFIQEALSVINMAQEEYIKYNRADIVAVVEKLTPEVESFVNEFGITATKCDIFEETLLRMADITQMPTKCKFDTEYSDKSRVTFTITNLNPQDVPKFLEFFQLTYEDDTAYTGAKRKRTFPAIGEPEMQRYRLKIPRDPNAPKDRVDSFSVDGEILYKKILPDFKVFLSDFAKKEKAIMKNYESLSELHLKNQKPQKSASPNIAKFFTKQDEPLAEVAEVAEVAEATEEDNNLTPVSMQNK